MDRWDWAWLAGLSACVLATGCPSNTCLLTVNGKCSWSTCPDGAEFNTARKTCLCQPNRVSLNGSCLTIEAANHYCGKGAHFENGGCAPNQVPGRASRSIKTPATASPPSRPPRWRATWACRSVRTRSSGVRRASSWSSKGSKRLASRCSKPAAETKFGTAARARRRCSARPAPATIRRPTPA